MSWPSQRPAPFLRAVPCNASVGGFVSSGSGRLDLCVCRCRNLGFGRRLGGSRDALGHFTVEAAGNAEMLVEDAAELENGPRIALGRMLRVVDHLLRGDPLQVSASIGDRPVILSGPVRVGPYWEWRVGRPAPRPSTGRPGGNEAMGGA